MATGAVGTFCAALAASAQPAGGAPASDAAAAALEQAAVATALPLWIVLCLQPAVPSARGGASAGGIDFPDVVSAIRGDARLGPALALLAARPGALERRVAVGCVASLTGCKYAGDPAPPAAVLIRDFTRPLRRLARVAGAGADNLTVSVVSAATAPGAQQQVGWRQPATPPPLGEPSTSAVAQEQGQEGQGPAPAAQQQEQPSPPPVERRGGAVLAEFRGNLELLAARCPFFRRRITEEMRAAGRGEITVTDDEARAKQRCESEARAKQSATLRLQWVPRASP